MGYSASIRTSARGLPAFNVWRGRLAQLGDAGAGEAGRVILERGARADHEGAYDGISASGAQSVARTSRAT